MQGMMMDYPLTLLPILERANRLFGKKTIVTRTASGTTRATYAELYARVRRLAGALQSLGIERGDRVASLCWNLRKKGLNGFTGTVASNADGYQVI